jgi:hypothetical protein
MKTADLRSAANDILGQVEGIQLDPKGFVKHRPRGGGLETAGGVYYGSTFFNSCDVAENRPELQLTRAGLRQTIRFGTDCFSVFVIGLEDLRKMVKQPQSGIIDWSFFNHVLIADGIAMVFLHNRPQFGRALAAAAGTNEVHSCIALNPDRRYGSTDWRL